jgi:hypothetical protein
MAQEIPSLTEHELIDRLVHQNHYTPEELSHLLGIGQHVIHHAAWTGELRAFVVNHHVLDILREDVLRWLERGGARAM